MRSEGICVEAVAAGTGSGSWCVGTLTLSRAQRNVSQHSRVSGCREACPCAWQRSLMPLKGEYETDICACGSILHSVRLGPTARGLDFSVFKVLVAQRRFEIRRRDYSCYSVGQGDTEGCAKKEQQLGTG